MDSVTKQPAVSEGFVTPKVPSVTISLKADPDAIFLRFRVKSRPIGLRIQPVHSGGDKKHEPGKEIFRGECVDVPMRDLGTLGYYLVDAWVAIGEDVSRGFYFVTFCYRKSEILELRLAGDAAKLYDACALATWKAVQVWQNPNKTISMNFIGKLDNHPVRKHLEVARKLS